MHVNLFQKLMIFELFARL